MMEMGDTLKFLRAKIACMDRFLFDQCMCNSGFAVYCLQVIDTTTTTATSGPTTEKPWPFVYDFENVAPVFGEEGNDLKQALNHETKTDLTSESSLQQMGHTFNWIEIVALVIFSLGIAFKCTQCLFQYASCFSQKACTAAAPAPHTAERSAGEAETGTAANNSDGGGGCGGGGQEATPTDPSSDLPPPYDLVFEQHPKPPPYEDVIREDAKMDPGEVV